MGKGLYSSLKSLLDLSIHIGFKDVEFGLLGAVYFFFLLGPQCIREQHTVSYINFYFKFCVENFSSTT